VLSWSRKPGAWHGNWVSTAEWTGVKLATVLEQAGLKRDAVEVILEGADEGEPGNEPRPPGTIHFARSLPPAKATSSSVLLAYKMNGADLPEAHGFPLRAVVAGWYGMASIKWLTRIIVSARPFYGYDQSVDYAIWQRRDGLPSLAPITEIEVKASIARPISGEVLRSDQEYRVFGAAWAGESDVAKVEVSTDRGSTWKEARLLDDAAPYCWRLWEFGWQTPAEGKATLMARATDQRGRVQAMKRDPDRRNYMISHVQPVEVTVKG
jgi:DMSO/TMAO reductase YedYZ molybdopterin-dependent catalytic subunit